MSAIILLFLRFALAITLYAFLGWALVSIWRDIKIQAEQLSYSQVTPIRLSFMEKDDLKDYRFSKAEITLGRDTSCDCLLNDKTVSNRHARLTFHHQRWWVEDIGSTNGTFLNQEAISTPMIVTSGDQITCGQIVLTIQLENQQT